MVANYDAGAKLRLVERTHFYRCYSNAWISLIPWLKANCGLDALSERFLRLWHYQNPPVEIPYEPSAPGLHDPIHDRSLIFPPEKVDSAEPGEASLSARPVGVAYFSDVFSGQVLSLHPLSWFIERDSALRELIGRFLVSPQYEAVTTIPTAQDCPEYWDFVTAILLAARSYRITYDRLAKDRGTRRVGRDVAVMAAAADELSAKLTLEDFAISQGMTCPQCEGQLKTQRYSPADEEGNFRVDFHCDACKKEVAIGMQSEAG